jgi:hypothetical protein
VSFGEILEKKDAATSRRRACTSDDVRAIVAQQQALGLANLIGK